MFRPLFTERCLQSCSQQLAGGTLMVLGKGDVSASCDIIQGGFKASVQWGLKVWAPQC